MLVALNRVGITKGITFEYILKVKPIDFVG
jgi:hypothetical protein